jgi:hypothetical protein
MKYKTQKNASNSTLARIDSLKNCAGKPWSKQMVISPLE